MQRIITYEIDHTAEGRKISSFLAEKGYSRQNLTDLKNSSPYAVSLNGEAARLRDTLRDGDCLCIRICEEKTSEQIRPVAAKLNIVYEDKDILVVNKPAGMPVHPTHGNPDNTLGNALMAEFGMRGETFVYRCINRLDRDTSGLTIVAKHSVSAAILGRQLEKEHELMQREYLAVVQGHLGVPEGTVRLPLARIPGDVLKMGIDRVNGQMAVTQYKVVGEKKGKSLVSCKLLTGKTHQIRVHMSYLGHPLLGDYLYHPEYSDNQVDRRRGGEIIAAADRSAAGRTMLHAEKLTFTHPITEKRMQLQAEMPEDMRRVWESTAF